MQSLRVLDRFSPSEAYLLTLLAAHHVEMIREEQLLSYLDRGMGITNRDARAALLESALLRSEEIEELDHFLTRKLERGPRDFRSIFRSMITPSVGRVLRHTRNEEARRLLADEPAPATQLQAAGAGGNGSGVNVGDDLEDAPEGASRPQAPSWIKAAVAIGLLLMVALAVVMPMDRGQPAGDDAENRSAVLGRMSPKQGDMVDLARALFFCLPNKAAVIDQMRHDPNLTQAQRSEALQAATDLDDSSELLNDSAWFVVRYAKGWPRGYQRALELANEAASLSPRNGLILNTLGVAQYRVGQYKEAVETLQKSNAINRNSRSGEHPADVGFLCMTYVKLGRTEDAREEFNVLKQLMKLEPWQTDLESIAISKEAAAAMGTTKANKN